MSLITYTYRPDPEYTGGPIGPVNVIVLHTLECPTGISSNGQGYARMLTGPNYLGASPMAQTKSVHYVVGAQDICASCPEDTKAWHARGASGGSIAIEQEGRAAFTEQDWATGDGHVITTNTGKLVGDIASRYNIPLRFLTGQALRDAYNDHSNKSIGGVTTHHELTRAGVGGNDHVDPGDAYPIDYVLSVAKGNAPTTPTVVKDWFDMATKDDLKAAVTEVVYSPEFLNSVAVAVLEHGLDTDKGLNERVSMIPKEVWEYMIQNQVQDAQGKTYLFQAQQFLGAIDRKVTPAS